MFGWKKKYDSELDEREGRHVAAEQTELPLNDFMTRLIAQELPVLDSHDRATIYRVLREYAESGKPQITSQEELPEEVREIMDL